MADAPNDLDPPVRVVWTTDDGTGACDRRLTVTERADVVVLTDERRVLFEPPHADRPWLRWAPDTALVFSWRQGRLRVLLRRRPPAAWTTRAGRRRGLPARRDLIHDLSARPGELADTIGFTRPGPDGEPPEAVVHRALTVAAERTAAIGRELGHPVPDCGVDHGTAALLAALAYPALGPALDAGLRLPGVLPTAITPALRRPTARQVAGVLFGRWATRPVVAAVGACLTGATAPAGELSLLPLVLAAATRTALAPDQRARVLRTGTVNHVEHLTPQGLQRLRWGLDTLPPPRVLRLLDDTMAEPGGPRLLVDAMSIWDELDPRPPQRRLPRDLRGFHDEVGRLYTEQRHRIEPLEAFPPELVALDGVELPGGLRLRVPRDTGVLTLWGRAMRNCIASYRQAARDGEAWLLGVEVDGELRYNLEIEPGGRVVQFTGPGNSAPDPGHRALVLDALTVAGIVRPSREQRRTLREPLRPAEPW
jgi:hypothetical protein